MASLLRLYSKPTVVFNVKNREHRKMAHRFLVDRSWRQCPVQFALPVGEDNVYTMIMRLMTAYYTEKEFGTIPKHDMDYLREQIVANSPQIVWNKK
jgi:hypothetical protein